MFAKIQLHISLKFRYFHSLTLSLSSLFIHLQNSLPHFYKNSRAINWNERKNKSERGEVTQNMKFCCCYLKIVHNSLSALLSLLNRVVFHFVLFTHFYRIDI